MAPLHLLMLEIRVSRIRDLGETSFALWVGGFVRIVKAPGSWDGRVPHSLRSLRLV